MTLRIPFTALQLLSAAIVACAFIAGPRAALAQTAPGTDYVILKPVTANAQPQQLANVLIVGVRGTKVTIRNAQGEIGQELSQIQEVRKAAPPEFAQGQRAIEEGKLEEALTLIRGVTERYKGLPVVWASDATATLGNLFISLGRLPEAETAFDEFQKYYPGAGSLAGSVGKARIAAERGKYAEARAAVEPLVKDALTKKDVSRAESQLYGQAFYVLGKVAEGEGKLPEAMENYCRTVAIFYQERAVVAAAEKRIEALRQKGITTP